MKKTLLLGSLCVLTGLGAVKLDTDKTPAYDSIAQAEITASSPQITLLNPGNEPKQELRFTPKVASKTISKMTMNTATTTLVDGQTMPQVNIPTITMNMEVEVTNVAENGDINTNFNYTDAEVVANENTTPEILSIMETQMNQLVGLSGSFLLDNRGNTKDVDIKYPENMDTNTQQMLASMVDSLTQLSAPFPTEAVGKGAKWQVINSFSTNGININQIATYELVDIQDKIATVNVKIEQQAGEQNIPSASMTLNSLTGIGEGEKKINLEQIMPITATIEMKSDMKMTNINPDNNQENVFETQSFTQINLQSKYE